MFVMQIAGIHALFVSNTMSKQKLLGPSMKVLNRFLVCPIARIPDLDDEWWYKSHLTILDDSKVPLESKIKKHPLQDTLWEDITGMPLAVLGIATQYVFKLEHSSKILNVCVAVCFSVL